MLKNKFKIIAILLTIILCISAPFALADDEKKEARDGSAEATSSEAPVEEQSTDEHTAEEHAAENEANGETSSTDNSFKKSDVYLAGGDITVDYVVDGNLFICADNVTISSQIGGDAFICAKSITITEQGYIFSNLFAATEDLQINGVVYDVYSCTKTTTISGYVYRDLKSTSETLNIYGTVGRNAFVSASKFNFTKEDTMISDEDGTESSSISAQGTISGDFNYSAKSEIQVPENSVGGEVKYTQDVSSNNNKTFVDYLISLLAFLVLVAVLWLLSIWLAPKFLVNTEALITKKFLPAFGYGILGLMLLPIIAVALLFLGITTSVGLLLLITYITLLCVSTSVFLIAANNAICTKFKLTKKSIIFGVLMVVSTLLWLISLIPYVGVIVKLICLIVGLGIIIKHILPHKEKNKETTEIKKAKKSEVKETKKSEKKDNE